MSQKPQRPFVPHRTPKENQAQSGPVEFRIAPPFVHRDERSATVPSQQTKTIAQQGTSISDFLAVDSAPAMSQSVAEQSMQSISDFMSPTDSTASIADFLAPESGFETTSGALPANSYELPPIEHFTDTGVEEEGGFFGVDEGPAHDSDPFGSAEPEAEVESFGWEETDWQRYDWRAAAALGESGDPEANSAWAQTDWGLGGSAPPPPLLPARDVGETAAKAIADALDGIARRIREGDLVLPSSPAAVPDPATIAATLAALLGVRR